MDSDSLLQSPPWASRNGTALLDLLLVLVTVGVLVSLCSPRIFLAHRSPSENPPGGWSREASLRFIEGVVGILGAQAAGEGDDGADAEPSPLFRALEAAWRTGQSPLLRLYYSATQRQCSTQPPDNGLYWEAAFYVDPQPRVPSSLPYLPVEVQVRVGVEGQGSSWVGNFQKYIHR